MAVFSKRSLKALETCHPDLQKVLKEAIKKFDFVITDSRRNKVDQEKAFKGGFSKVRYGDSAHNWTPALAVDIYPWPIIWDRPDYQDKTAFRKQAGVILAAAKKLKIPLRWGGDFNMDSNFKNDKFVDAPHFELHPWREYAKKARLYNGA